MRKTTAIKWALTDEHNTPLATLDWDANDTPVVVLSGLPVLTPKMWRVMKRCVDDLFNSHEEVK